MSEVMLGQLKLAKPLLKSLTIENARKYQDILGELGAKALSHKIGYIPAELTGGAEAEYAVPEQLTGDYAVLYLHGGSYTAGSLAYAKGFGGILADKLGCKVLCLGYRLAPEHPHPAALEDAYSAFKLLEKEYSDKKIVLVGESAGGGLCLALALYLKSRGEHLPACIAALSPWTDLTFTGKSFETNKERDPMLSEEALKYSAELYRGDTPADNPFVSPIYGDYSGFNPVMLMAGSAEILLDDTIMTAKKIASYGVDVTLNIEENMWHAYVLYGTPEAKKALRMIKKFTEENTL